MCAYDTVLNDVTSKPRRESFESLSTRRMVRWQNMLPHSTAPQLAVLAVVCAVFLVTSFYPLHHTDLWGHLTYGRWIAENGQLPEVDPLAAADVAQPMTHVSWLAQVAGYQCWKIAGPGGLQLAHALLATLTIMVVMAAIRARGLSLAWIAAGGITAYLLALPIMGVIRPQLFGVLAMALALLAVARLRKHRDPLVWLPLVFIAWCNLHGSFVVGLIVVGCFLVDAIVAALRASGARAAANDVSVRRGFILLVLATCAVMINPHGISLLIEALTFGQNENLRGISEWQPTVLMSLTGGLFFGSLLITGVFLRVSPRQITLYETLLLVGLGIATLLATRMLIWWALVWPVVMIPHAAATFATRRPADSIGRVVPATAMNTLIAVAMLFVTLVVSPVGDAIVTGNERSEAVVVSKETPVFLADEIDKLGISGTVFAPMKWADYLLWHSGNAVQPLVAAHVHLVADGVWADYQSLSRGADNWPEIIRRRGIEYLVLEHRTNRPLVHDIRNRLDESAYRVLYQDQRGLIMQILPDAAADAEVEVDVKQLEQATDRRAPQVKPSKQTAAKNSLASPLKEKS